MKSFRVEMQPTPTQRARFLQHAGCARWAWNWGLRRKQEAWALRKGALAAGAAKAEAPKVPTAIDLHRELNLLKKVPTVQGGVPWMYESSKWAPQESLRNLDRAFQAFFRRLKAGEKPGHPRFKSRSRGVGGFRLSAPTHVGEKTVKLPKIGRVRLKPGCHSYIPTGTYTSVTVKEHGGRWYASVLIEEEAPSAPPSDRPPVGVDVGVARLATLSDGTVFENPSSFARYQKRLRRAQKTLCRRKKGSHRRRKVKARVARLHHTITHLRSNATHQATSRIAKNHGVIVIEDLKVSNMTRRARGRGRAAKAGLNRVVLDANFAEFRRQITYKAAWYGSTVVAVDPAYTSQRCSSCGHTDSGNRPSQAVFRCLACGHESNADLNAARNILVAGSCPETLNARGANVRPGRLRPTRQSAVKRESAGDADL